MDVLFLANDINAPSHLWMRRMLDGLGVDVVSVVTERPFHQHQRGRYDVRILLETPALWRRVLNRLRLTKRCPWEFDHLEKLRRAVDSPTISTVFVHFLTMAVKYEWVWSRTAKPVYVHCHGYDVTWDLHKSDASGSLVHAPDYVARVRELPDHVSFIANSYVTKRRLENIGIAAERIHVKYLGVEVPAEFSTRRPTNEPINILYLGRLVDFKGPELLIRAFDRACDQGMDARLTIAGDGPLRFACELARARSAYQDWIELLGAVDADTGARLRSNADIFTAHNCQGPITRQEEAFGVSIVEAMAAGLPIVTGRSGSIPEILDDDVEGILVEPGDIDGHAAALQKLANDAALREAMGRCGWARVQRCFRIDRELQRLRLLLGKKPYL